VRRDEQRGGKTTNPVAPVSKIPVALMDDDAPYRAYAGTLIAASGQDALLAQAGSVAEAAVWAAKVQPALLLLDVAMPGVQDRRRWRSYWRNGRG
jgi:DNA-binding NarL/FixJ family response regulator